jgi:hypothetical protein
MADRAEALLNVVRYILITVPSSPHPSRIQTIFLQDSKTRERLQEALVPLLPYSEPTTEPSL